MAKGHCRCCGKEGTVNADGTMRHHQPPADKLECFAGPDSKRCQGAGQPPAEAKAEATRLRFVCRVPAGPTGCGRPVTLTANHRTRSHLDGQDQRCGGGSDWPLAVDPDGPRYDTAEWSEEDWRRALGQPDEEEHDEDTCLQCQDDPDYCPSSSVNAGGYPCPYCKGALYRNLDRHIELEHPTRVNDGRTVEQEEEMARRRADPVGSALAALNRPLYDPRDPEGPGVTTTAELLSAISEEEAQMDSGWGPTQPSPLDRLSKQEYDSTLIADPARLFDVTHMYDDGAGGLWKHPGTAENCRRPECCPHDRGYEWADDENGHSGSACRDCGAPEPEPHTHVEPVYGGTDEDGADVWFCPECGERETPAVTRMKMGRRAACLLGDLEVGEHFTRSNPPGLVFRLESVAADMASAVVVSAGPYAGRSGELTDLTEEVTCTDQDGKRTLPRRARSVFDGQAQARRQPISTGQPKPSNASPASTPLPQPTPTPSPQAETRRPTGGGPGSGRRATPNATAAGTPSPRATESGPTAKAGTSARTAGTTMTDAFTTPKAAVKESDKYDSYGRYKLTHPKTGKPVKWTRATTFAKSVQDTYALSMWSQRMVLKGAAMRPDIVDAASTLDVKQDKDRMNGLVEEAKKAAGDKVAANMGTAVHAYTEDRDKYLAGLVTTVAEIPARHLPTVDAYEAVLKDFGLEPVPGLIEFTTAVQQYEIAGTSDRVYRVTKNITFELKGRMVTLYAGEYVIGDVKTGADLSYGWQEIAIQLSIYGQGLNTSGVFDWNTSAWSYPTTIEDKAVRLQVRTDIGIVPHLPVDRGPKTPLATLYAVDMDAGWAAAVMCASVRTWRKTSGLATPLKVAMVDLAAGVVAQPRQEGAPASASVPQQPTAAQAPESRPATLEDEAQAVRNRGEASAVFQKAVAQKVTRARLDALVDVMNAKLESHVEPGA